MLSNASGDIYRRNRRWGVPGADNLGMRQFAGMQRSAAVAPNVAALNSSRMMNSRGGSPLAQIGMALQGAPPPYAQGMMQQPQTLPPYMQGMMQQQQRPTPRPRRRTTPYL